MVAARHSRSPASRTLAAPSGHAANAPKLTLFPADDAMNHADQFTEHVYGRGLDDFHPGDEYRHPFEITVDAGLVAAYSASFMDTCPMWSSDRYARAWQLPGRPVSNHLAFNLALSMSVHDVSQQGTGHMAYVRVKFPKPLHVGTTVNATSRVLGARPSSGRSRGVVQIHTVLVDDDNERVVDLERLAIVRPGKLTQRPGLPQTHVGEALAALWMGRLPAQDFGMALSARRPVTPLFDPPLFGCFEDLTPGLVLAHNAGRTVGESEHLQLATLLRNSHPMHLDALHCERHGPTPRPNVYGGLIMAWTISLASVDVGAHALWDLEWSQGAHPGFVFGGDTLYAATKVLDRRVINDYLGVVRMRHVAVKNALPAALLQAGADLFSPELPKTVALGVPEKVFEITREILVRRFGH